MDLEHNSREIVPDCFEKNPNIKYTRQELTIIEGTEKGGENDTSEGATERFWGKLEAQKNKKYQEDQKNYRNKN